MAELDYYTLNVFSEKGIYGGNQLGVVLDLDDELTSEEMQTIAKQFNYSESTFIKNMNKEGGEIKIFLPNTEINFAGHPTIGTSFLIEYLWRKDNFSRNEITLKLKKGPIKIKFLSDQNDNIKQTVMTQFQPTYRGKFDDIESVCKILKISKSDLLVEEPFEIISPSDLPFLFIPIKSISKLSELELNPAKYISLIGELKCDPFIYANMGIDGGDVHARFFAPFNSIVEDPATGSAQASLAQNMLNLNLISDQNGIQEIITEQGYEMGRPSKIYNKLNLNNSKILDVQTGGNSYIVSKGKLYFNR